MKIDQFRPTYLLHSIGGIVGLLTETIARSNGIEATNVYRRAISYLHSISKKEMLTPIVPIFRHTVNTKIGHIGLAAIGRKINLMPP